LKPNPEHPKELGLAPCPEHPERLGLEILFLLLLVITALTPAPNTPKGWDWNPAPNTPKGWDWRNCCGCCLLVKLKYYCVNLLLLRSEELRVVKVCIR
jgi:hypothetical protein